MIPSLRTFIGILIAAGLATSTLWLFYQNSAPSPSLSEPVHLMNNDICWAIRINDPGSLIEKKTKHPVLSEILTQSEWINKAIIELNKDSLAIPFVVFQNSCSDSGPILSMGAPLSSSSSQILDFIEERFKTRAKKTDKGYVFDGLSDLKMIFHEGCVFIAPRFDFDIISLTKQETGSLMQGWSASADMNLYCSSGSAFLDSNENYDVSHPFSGDVYFRNESVEFHCISFPESIKHSLYGKREKGRLNLEKFIPKSCDRINIDHFGNAENVRNSRISNLDSQGKLAEWNRQQAQLENSLNLVIDEVTFEWSEGSLASFQWDKAKNTSFLILSQSDSIAFGEALVQLPGVELTEDNNHFYLKWDNADLWANALPPPYDLEVNCATLRGDAVILSSNMAHLKMYSRHMDRSKNADSEDNYHQKIEINTSQIPFSKGAWGALFQSALVSSTYPDAHLSFYHGEDKRSFIHLSAGAREQIESGPSVEWEVTLQKDLLKMPVWIRNHSNSEYYAVWQDTDLTAHAFDARGKEMWTIPLKEEILGDVHQIDLYRNGKYQFIFATSTALHCYDRLGKPVDGYPYKFTSNASSNLGVFDYDRNKNYRFVIGLEDGSILNIKDEGIATKGWKAQTQASPIAKVKHLKAGSKDYVFTLNEDGKIHLLKRNGETRYETKAALPSSTVDLEFLMKSTIDKSSVFVIDTAKRVVQINFNDGKMGEMTGIGSATDLLLSDIDGDLVSDLILANGSTLEAYNSARQKIFKTTLDGEIEGKPKLYNLEDGMAIGVLLKEQNKIVFLSPDGTLMDEDGLYGTALPVVKDADKDGHAEGITLHGNRTVVCYEF